MARNGVGRERMMQKLKWYYRAWRYRLKVERQEILNLLQNLDPGDTAVDVGAHKGAYTYWMRRKVGQQGQVIAFEPQKGLADKLRRLVESSSYDNVEIENLGLSASAGTMTLNIPGEGASPSASFEDNPEGDESARGVSVTVSTLDQYFAARPQSKIRLIKCDAEGHELEVFAGGEQLLSSQHPVLLFECEARHRKSGTVDEVFSWLTGLGYRGYYLGKDGLHDIAEFDQATHQAQPGGRGYINNFLFRKDDAAASGE